MITRKFNGKAFRPVASYPKKSDAQKKAFQERIGGIRLARVVKEGSYWVVYTHQIKKPRPKPKTTAPAPIRTKPDTSIAIGRLFRRKGRR